MLTKLIASQTHTHTTSQLTVCFVIREEEAEAEEKRNNS